MTATQQHFLGCSIRNFNLNMGWGDESTTLEVGLVEDDYLFERFNGFIGQLVRFQYDNFTFDGILSNLKEQKNQSGNRVWQAVISDPREFLSGIQLIVGGYTGFTFDVPNLYNVYGYLESFGYGNSLISDAGIPWYLIRDAFMNLNQTTPAYLAGYPYLIDLSMLPPVPNDYRISSTNVSLLDFIQEICELANYDFTVLLIGNYITIVTVNRNIPILNGSIARLLQRLPQYSNMEAGFELQYNTANKFLVGGQVEQMYYQFNYGEDVNQSGTPLFDDTIARYWGTDTLGNLKIAQPGVSSTARIPGNNNLQPLNEDNEIITIPGNKLDLPGVQWHEYITDMDELRCALDSRETWEGFLSNYNIASGRTESIHYGKHDRIKIPPDINMEALKDPNKSIFDITPLQLSKLERNQYARSNFDDYAQKFFDLIYDFASEYMDKKFMVRIPFVLGKLNPDAPFSLNPDIITSLEPSDSAYIDENINPLQAIGNGLIPEYPEFILNEENKIVCYVRFGPYNYANIDLGEIPESDYYIQNNFVFVKAEVDPKLVFLNKSNAFSPRAVITLPGRVKYTDERFILSIIENEYVNNKPESERLQAQEDFRAWSNTIGADVLSLNREKYGLKPNMAAIPLKNNLETYGPWYTQGAQGKVEFTQDFDLVPWNYGGFANMNLAGQSMVQDAYVNNMIGETGSVEVPGSPVFSIAQQIFAGGPTITQISTSIGEQGITTTYRMEKWNQQYGKAIRHRNEQFKKIHALRREGSKNFKKLFKPEAPPNKSIRLGSISNLAKKPRRNQTRSTHNMMMSNVSVSESGFNKYSVGLIPSYQVQKTLDVDDWETVAGCSLDALFIPYNTQPKDYDSEDKIMPHFEKSTGGVIPRVEHLNPFQDGHNVTSIVNGVGASNYSDLNGEDRSNMIRGMALRGPLVLASWGYDTEGNPIPSGSGGSFASGYLEDTSAWKVGPVDFKWNDSRKVWEAGGGSNGIDQYVRDLRTFFSGSYRLFQYEIYNVTEGSGTWNTWFATGGCLEEFSS